MSQVAVQRIHSNETDASPIVEQMKSLAERIRERAYHLFERKGRNDGSALNDWLEAEDDLLMIPQSELIENDGKFEMQVAVPGFDAKDIEVDALPDTIVVRAQASHKHDGKDGKIQFCEFSEKSLFRRFDFPTGVDVDRVVADLDKGLLKISAPKAEGTSAKASASAA
jgi:HSP20 family protein